MPKNEDVDKIIDRVLWMPMPTLESLSAGFVKNQRTEQRYPSETEARLVQSGAEDEQPVKVKNISKSGLGIEAAFPLEVGSVATVIVGTTVLMGQIRWCRMDKDAFEAGILAQRVGFMQ
jgi:hypothetical protein